MVFAGEAAPVHIDHIRKGLEGVKRDTHRQQQRKADRGTDEQPAHRADNKGAVFEQSQTAQAHCPCQKQPGLSRRRAFRLLNALCTQPGDQGSARQ